MNIFNGHNFTEYFEKNVHEIISYNDDFSFKYYSLYVCKDCNLIFAVPKHVDNVYDDTHYLHYADHLQNSYPLNDRLDWISINFKNILSCNESIIQKIIK